MDPVLFYGKSKNKISIRELPDDSEDSELSSEEDEVQEDCILSSSDSSSSDDDDDAEEGAPASGLPLANSSRPIIWREKTDQADRSSNIPDFLGTEREPGLLREPIEYFRDIFSTETLETIVTESNRYSLQQDINKPADITMDELEQFLGIIFYMSVDRLPRARLYWSPETRVPRVADTMSQKLFEEIKRFLHFSNNEEINRDKLHKVKPLLDVFKASVRSIPKSKMISIDEQIIPFKGKSSLKQYNPKKPKKWGYKVFVCSGNTGLIHDFEFYVGQIQPCPGKPDLGASGNIVLRLLQDVPRNCWHQVFFDNWFTSIPLQVLLWKEGIASVGTVRANRLKGCTFPPYKELSRKGRGSVVLKTGVVDSVQLNAVRWMDNKAVTLLSTFAAIEPVKKVRRWDKKEKKDVEVDCPSIIILYNAFMGGVDLLDSLVALYRNHIRSKKWYHRITFHVFDLAVVQGWLLYVFDFSNSGLPPSAKLPLLQFKINIALCLMRQHKTLMAKKRGRPSLEVEAQLQSKKQKGPAAAVPNFSIRTDNMGHFPLQVSEKGRCKLPGCKGFSRTKCEKCNVHLCLTLKSNCYKLFHQP